MELLHHVGIEGFRLALHVLDTKSNNTSILIILLPFRQGLFRGPADCVLFMGSDRFGNMPISLISNSILGNIGTTCECLPVNLSTQFLAKSIRLGLHHETIQFYLLELKGLIKVQHFSLENSFEQNKMAFSFRTFFTAYLINKYYISAPPESRSYSVNLNGKMWPAIIGFRRFHQCIP